ncbi:MAG: alpha/beta fold hydrolase [Sporichthyaceae bacterium]
MRPTIVGHSLGGGIALQFCYQYPYACDRLVLASAGGLGRELHPVLRAAALPGAELVLPLLAHAKVTGAAARLAGAWRRLSAREVAGGSPSVDAYASLADSARRRAFVISARNVIDLAGQRVSGLDRMYLTAEMPTMAVWGGRDPIIPSAHGRQAMADLAQGRFELFELAGHFPHCDEPVRFARVLLDFLATTRPAELDVDVVAARIATGRPVLDR